MFLSELEIENYRGIESLKIDKIKQVNLIVGKNNSGKTSILEAIFLLMGMSDSQLALNVHNFRSLRLTNNQDFSYLFPQFDFSKEPLIKGSLDSETRTLKLTPSYEKILPEMTNGKAKNQELSSIPTEVSVSSSSNTYKTIEGLTFNFKENDKATYKKDTVFLDRGIPYFKPREFSYKEKAQASFINSRTIQNNVAKQLDTLTASKNLEPIINSLKEIEPKLTDIRIQSNGLILVDIGFSKYSPLNIIGDGIIGILSILAAISERKNSILLIDEIENGLHYSSLATLWKAVFKAAKANNVQLFITTHSYECVRAFDEIYKSSDGLKDDFISLFRINKHKEGKHRITPYSAELLSTATEENFEVR